MIHDHRTAFGTDATHGFDEFERGLLIVLRHLMTSYARPESQAWELAFGIAVERWGVADGPRIAQGVLAVVQALRRCRTARFRHADPLDAEARLRLTPDEENFIHMLHAMRRDRTAEARQRVALLTGGQMDPAMIRSALSLAARFPAVDCGPARPVAPASGLRLVH